jgi:hypothetical protein
MFDNECTVCGKRQLIFPSQIQAITNTDAGIVVAYTCWCGAEQAWVTGRSHADRRLVAA